MSIPLYKTYLFKNKDPMIFQISKVMKENKISIRAASNDSGVTESCINGWLYGATRRPQFATLKAVAKAIGCDISPSEKEGN